MIYGYIRVSSDKQTVENQRFAKLKGPVDVQNEIIECVQENLVQKNKKQEDRINHMVYQLYGFDNMEADYIKSIL